MTTQDASPQIARPPAARRRRRLRRAVVLALLAALLILGSIGVREWVRQTNRIAGTYLTEGGTGYVKLRRKALFNWWIAGEYPQTILNYNVLCLGRRMVFSTPGQGPGAQPASFFGRSTLVFIPSEKRDGDWDLVLKAVDLPDMTALPGGKSQLELWWDRLFSREELEFEPQIAIPFIHRVDDPRIPECYDELVDLILFMMEQQPAAAVLDEWLPLYERTYTERARQTIEQRKARISAKAHAVLEDHPDDLHIRAFYLYIAANLDRVDEVESRLDEWRAEFEQNADPHFPWICRLYENWCEARRLSRQGLNAFDLTARLFSKQTDLETVLNRLPEIRKMEAYRAPGLPPHARLWPMVNFLNVQVGIKTARIMATLRLFQGERAEALKILGACARLGQMMSQDGELLSRLVGTALLAISSGGLEVYMLNACETDEEFRELWALLEGLESNQEEPTTATMMALQAPTSLNQSEGYREMFFNAAARARVAHSRFELLRMAGAARYRFLFGGDFPTTNSEFAPLLPDGPPQDIFSDEPLRFVTTNGGLSCYSVGPDRRDDRASIAYDPTNGTISGGDLILEVPRKRKYPFPRGGVRATSAEDLRRQFPNGLPPDSFATNRGRGLSVAESDEGDVFVFSFGPDVDEYKQPNPLALNAIPATGTVLLATEIPPDRTAPPHRLQVMYDPTNGIMSEGDLYIRLER